MVHVQYAQSATIGLQKEDKSLLAKAHLHLCTQSALQQPNLKMNYLQGK